MGAQSKEVYDMTNPCFKCEERTPKCHSECEKYKKFKIDHAAEQKKKKDFEEKHKYRTDINFK